MNDMKPDVNRFSSEHKPVERTKQEKVIKGTAKTRKNNLRNISNNFFAEDLKSVAAFVLASVIIPKAKDLICDVVIKGVCSLFKGTSDSGSSSSYPATRYTFRSYNPEDDVPFDYRSSYGRNTKVRQRPNYDDIVLTNRTDAEEVLRRMQETIERRGVVSILDLYDFVGVPTEFTDDHYGWISLRGAGVVPVSDGWLLKLPRAAALN